GLRGIMPSSKVMPKFKAGKLHSGSKKGPGGTNPKKALAIKISEQRKEKQGKKPEAFIPYLMIDDFAGGLDTRKSAITSPAGTLQRLNDCVITPGGEIAKRKAFVQVADLSGTFGLAATEANLYAFT